MMRTFEKILLVFAILLLGVALLNGCHGGGGSSVIVIGPAPAAPTGLTATVSPNTVKLTWNAVPQASSYRVYYETSPGLTKSTGIPLPTTTGTSYTHSGRTNGATYYYVVTALNNYNKEGPNSAEISAKLAVPGPPATVIAVASSGTGTPQVNLNWTAASDATSYNVYRSGSLPISGPSLSTNLTSLSYLDTSVTLSTTYYYAVSATDAFGEGQLSNAVSATPISAPSNTLTISGNVVYEDKEYNRTVGFTGITTFNAVRFADVELVNAAGSLVVSSGMTTSTGSYSFSIPSSFIDASMYVRVMSAATPAATQSMSVKKWNATDLYSVKTANFTLYGNTSINLSIPVTSPADGAFNILDVMTSGFQFINTYAANATGLSLNAFWENGVSNGTWYCSNGSPPDPTYCPGGTGISVFSDPFGSGDTDEFDDDVLVHEFGHFTVDNFSKDDSMGGQHYLNGNDYDMRLTWSEGWGDFFPGAVKSWLNVIDPTLISSAAGVPLSQYVDTVNGYYPLIVDVADPDDTVGSPYCRNPYHSGTPMCKYSTNEIAVANVLWNHMTGSGDYVMQNVWNIIAGFKTANEPVNLELFYDRWKNLYGYPSTTMYTNRSIYYSDDVYEADNDFSSAPTFTVNTTEDRRLYSSVTWTNADEDYIKFIASAGTFTITTSNLLNGADTYLTLYNFSEQDITPVTPKKRDNTNGITWVAGSNYDTYDVNWNWLAAPLNTTTNLASEIVWTAPSSTTYYVKISPSPNRPRSAGKYGSYTLTITSP